MLFSINDIFFQEIDTQLAEGVESAEEELQSAECVVLSNDIRDQDNATNKAILKDVRKTYSQIGQLCDEMIGLEDVGGVPNQDAEYVLDAVILKQTHNALSQIEKLRTGHLINKEKQKK